MQKDNKLSRITETMFLGEYMTKVASTIISDNYSEEVFAEAMRVCDDKRYFADLIYNLNRMYKHLQYLRPSDLCPMLHPPIEEYKAWFLHKDAEFEMALLKKGNRHFWTGKINVSPCSHLNSLTAIEERYLELTSGAFANKIYDLKDIAEMPEFNCKPQDIDEIGQIIELNLDMEELEDSLGLKRDVFEIED